MDYCPREFEVNGVVSPFFDCQDCPFAYIYRNLTFCNYVQQNIPNFRHYE